MAVPYKRIVRNGVRTHDTRDEEYRYDGKDTCRGGHRGFAGNYAAFYDRRLLYGGAGRRFRRHDMRCGMPLRT